MTETRQGSTARADWEARIGRRSDVSRPEGLPHLPAPAGLRATEGRGQVTLSWEPVAGAVGYVVFKAPPGEEPAPVDTGGPDVIAVPGPPFADTTGRVDEVAEYAVAAIPAAGNGPGDPGPFGDTSEVVRARRLATGDAAVTVAVDAAHPHGRLPRPWRPMIGAEHLAQLFYDVGPGGHHIGTEFREALRLAHDELGVRGVRAHAILHDELGVYREVDGRAMHDFSAIDRVYDAVLETGLHPVVEISFMPRDLARDPEATVFEYGAIISPPKDWDRWAELIGELALHLVERYGLDEVCGWGFEVWNEANLEVFWSGSRDEYLRLYDLTAGAVKAVDARLPVGGPSSAASGWVEELLAHCAAGDVPLDFVTTHTYGNMPLDLREAYARHGFPRDLPTWWTEWGVNATHFNALHDSAFAGAFLAKGMGSVMGRLEALAYWVVSDHFEELGRPPRLLHGGFGLLTVGNLRKPRYWILRMLELLGDEQLAARVSGDGAVSLVDAVATRRPDGTLAVVAWNATIDHAAAGGRPLLDRSATIVVDGVGDGRWRLRHRRVDDRHSNIGRVWTEIGGGRDWPSEEQWAVLRGRNVLEDLEPPVELTAANGRIEISFELPISGVSLIELERVG